MSHMEQCVAHEDDLFAELDGETWQYLTFMSDCWLEHPTPEEPHYED